MKQGKDALIQLLDKAFDIGVNDNSICSDEQNTITENTSENTDKDYINDHPQLPNGDYQIEQVQLISEECMNETNYTKNTFSGLKPIGINGDSSQIQPTRRSGKYKAGNFSNLEKMIQAR